MRGGGWCQGLGSFDLRWETLPGRAACIDRLRGAAAALLNSVPERPPNRVQEKAPDELLCKLTALGKARFD